MDFESLNLTPSADEGAWMPVEHPTTGEKLAGVRVLLAGRDSDRYKKALHRYANERAKKGKVSAEAVESANINIAVACTLKWEGIEEGGTKLECSADMVSQMYRKYRWLYEQVDGFIADRVNFFADDKEGTEGKSSTGSAGASA